MERDPYWGIFGILSFYKLMHYKYLYFMPPYYAVNIWKRVA